MSYCVDCRCESFSIGVLYSVLKCLYVLSSVMSTPIYAYKLCSVRLYPQLYVGGRCFIYVICVCQRIQWCLSRLDYMSNISGILLEAGTTYPSRAIGFIPGLWWLHLAHLLSFLCCVVFLCFVCLRLRLVSCVPITASVSVLFILDYPFSFL